MVVDPISLGVGTGIAVAGILLAFKGVVDSGNLVADLVEKDKGQSILALEYFVELQKTIVWGDDCRLDDGDQSLLAAEPLATRRMIAGVLAEMKWCTERAAHYITRYDMAATEDNLKSRDAAALASPIQAAMDFKATQDTAKPKHPVRWVIRDKGEFTKIVQYLKSLNTDLRDLTRGADKVSLAAALSASLLPQIKETMTLRVLADSATADPLLKLSAQLKLLQENSDHIQAPPTSFSYETYFKQDDNQLDGSRITGYFRREDSLELRSWLEWRDVKSDLSAENQDLVASRIHALSQMLVAAAASQAAEYSLPPCQGLLIDDRIDMPNSVKERFAFVFSVPDQMKMPENGPLTLLQLVGDGNFYPFLNFRFELAYKLASAMSLMHASKWLHKSFRSDNILFLLDETSGNVVINKPFLAGFEYSRPEAELSVRDRPTNRFDLNLYYHPDVPMQDFTRLHDIYSLGVVLLEIAYWSPLKAEVKEYQTRTEMKASFLSDDTMNAVGGSMGSAYRDAVEACLTGNFDVDNGIGLSRSFFAKVLRKLSYCRV